MAGWEEYLTFYPSKYPAGYYSVPDRHNLAIEDHNFTTQDGLKLHAWLARPKKDKSDFWLLWFTGNGGNISYRLEWILGMAEIPSNVFIIDYRGYGRSEGEPTEKGVYMDAEAAYTYLTQNLAVPPGKIILFGESLGGAVAIRLASQAECAGLIVQSAFTNAKDMAKRIMPVLPLWLIIKTKFDNLGKIQNVKVPKLFIHAEKDEIVPLKLGKRLFKASPEPKRFYEVKGARHNDTFYAGGRQYMNTIREFVRSLSPP